MESSVQTMSSRVIEFTLHGLLWLLLGHKSAPVLVLSPLPLGILHSLFQIGRLVDRPKSERTCPRQFDPSVFLPR